MDTGLLNFGKESFQSNYYECPGADDNPNGINHRRYDWEDRKRNVDLALKSMTDEFCQSIQDVADMFPNDIFQAVAVDCQYLDQLNGENLSTEGDLSNINFDLATFIDNVEPAKSVPAQIVELKPRAGVKKIDMKAKKYIVKDEDDDDDNNNDDDNGDKDEEEVDIETVSNNPPVLEAIDAFSLLEQFEKTENVGVPVNQSSDVPYVNLMWRMDEIENPKDVFERINKCPDEIFNIPHDDDDGDNKIFGNNNLVDFQAVLDNESADAVFKIHNKTDDGTEQKKRKKVDDGAKTKLLTKIHEDDKTDIIKESDSTRKETLPIVKSSFTPSRGVCDLKNNKQILEALPQDLIQRINESGKRKKITVIDAMPNRKRGASKMFDNISQMKVAKIQKVTHEQSLIPIVHLDHNYCLLPTYGMLNGMKESKKDSGFVSSEDDDRNTINNQPVVKNTDGKLMVSLLKINTVRNEGNKKKKLNLEEYKKRRLVNNCPNSASSSTCSSPLPRSQCNSPTPDDEQLKRFKYEEKMKKMTAELLKTMPSSIKKIDKTPTPPPPLPPPPPPPPPPQSSSSMKTENTDCIKPVIVEKTKIITPPPDLEVKTFVSVGCNTDFDVESAEQLAEIKPLLQKVSNKINSNSFINSLIENIPKLKCKSPPNSLTDNNNKNHEIVRENKTIQYLRKDRPLIKMRHADCQTNLSLVSEVKMARYRRRNYSTSSSSSSCGSSPAYYRRAVSRSSYRSQKSRSRCSSSSYSSTSRTRSRSRSLSPISQPMLKKYDEERLREVEERRVIYVGRLTKGTNKEDLRRRFYHFGPITYISLHFREYGDNYGFVTFANKEDAYEAVEHGNDHGFPKYDLSFGGRRIFCKTNYSDLDDMREEYGSFATRADEIPFDVLLRATQEELRRRRP